MITIYTDGSSRGNPGPGGWGAIIVYPEPGRGAEWVREIGGGEAYTTNNRMELTAALKALNLVSGGKVEVHTDSEYVMKGMTQWIENWQKKGWKTASKKPVENQDLWKKLLIASGGKDISWQYVAGHSDHSANDRCDEIATSFADKIKIDLYDGSRTRYRVNLK